MQNKAYSRRAFLRLSAVTASTVLLAACITPPTQPAANPSSAAQAPTTVRYANFDWWAFTPGVQWDAFHKQEAFPHFQAEHPNVELVWEPFGDYGSGWDSKVLTQMAAGTAPDVLSGWAPLTNLWTEKKQLLDLQPLVKADIPDAEQKFQKSVWDQTWDPVNKIRLGLAADVIVGSVYYDKQAFTDAGVPLPTQDWNTEAYTQAAVKLTQKDRSGKITRWGGQLRPDFTQGYFLYVEAFGGQVRDAETMLTCQLDQAPAQQALEWIRHGMWDLNCFAQDNQVNATGIPNTWTGVLPAKIVAFAERVSDQFFALADALPEGAWDVAHLPQAAHNRACMGIPDLWSIYQGVTARGNQDAAWQFTKWLATSDYYQGNIAAKAGRIPALNSAAAQWPQILRQIEPKLQSVNLELVLDQIKSGEAHGLQLFRFQSAADELLNPAMQQIYTEGKAGVEILKEIAPKVTAGQQAALKLASGA